MVTDERKRYAGNQALDQISARLSLRTKTWLTILYGMGNH